MTGIWLYSSIVSARLVDSKSPKGRKESFTGRPGQVYVATPVRMELVCAELRPFLTEFVLAQFGFRVTRTTP